MRGHRYRKTVSVICLALSILLVITMSAGCGSKSINPTSVTYNIVVDDNEFIVTLASAENDTYAASIIGAKKATKTVEKSSIVSGSWLAEHTNILVVPDKLTITPNTGKSDEPALDIVVTAVTGNSDEFAEFDALDISQLQENVSITLPSTIIIDEGMVLSPTADGYELLDVNEDMTFDKLPADYRGKTIKPSQSYIDAIITNFAAEIEKSKDDSDALQVLITELEKLLSFFDGSIQELTKLYTNVSQAKTNLDIANSGGRIQPPGRGESNPDFNSSIPAGDYFDITYNDWILHMYVNSGGYGYIVDENIDPKGLDGIAIITMCTKYLEGLGYTITGAAYTPKGSSSVTWAE